MENSTKLQAIASLNPNLFFEQRSPVTCAPPTRNGTSRHSPARSGGWVAAVFSRSLESLQY
ncbi:hypothetical protein I8748_18420 [Nostoc sp. CENA67]|uniref:Uncharacterized protein n=1 Tax=Amazonocrinis nigriterrae CENA67 TaxID=2794033 RepID=A0A8J7HVN5_9NOST|nr:hypothetical protein [Amazonocrinis nigriterrae]MBH8564137.1 hypothetical protein [Amazonocrinis nigriterrae CENA67]